MGFIRWQSSRQVRTMYSPVLEHAGEVTICIAGVMLLLGSTKTERVADLSLLCAIDWRQPVPRWYGYCNCLRSTRKGKAS